MVKTNACANLELGTIQALIDLLFEICTRQLSQVRKGKMQYRTLMKWTIALEKGDEIKNRSTGEIAKVTGKAFQVQGEKWGRWLIPVRAKCGELLAYPIYWAPK